jgi:DNA invertase Pin-like site-specific DNA recombinase
LVIGKKNGYARISTQDQNLSLKEDELKFAGCKQVFTDKASGAKSDRQGLKKCLETLQPGDTLIVWRLDRLGQSMPPSIAKIRSRKFRTGNHVTWKTKIQLSGFRRQTHRRSSPKCFV